MTAKAIKDFEVIDHGIEHAQFFQGCGVAHTSYEHCVTGCGESAADAFESALNDIAQQDFDCAKIEQSDDGKLFQSDKASTAVEGISGTEHELGEHSELYYYVSIRWN